ncbi:MAG TPA: hypothetical protein VGE74_00395 [Gemmata sp.]
MPARVRAPQANGAVLAEPGFDAVPGLVAANRERLDRRDVRVGGLPLHELRALARHEALGLAHEVSGPPLPRSGSAPPGPLLLAGHQPELSHPGVWVKNFALNGLAHRLNGVPLNLIVDNDTLKSTAIRFPTFRDRTAASVRLESLAFDTFSGEVPYEDRRVEGAGGARAFESFAHRAQPLWANWGYEPLLRRAWPGVVHHHPTEPIGERFSQLRQRYEREWGCDNLELPVSRLSQTQAFVRFAGHVLGDLPRFRAVYNAAVRAYRTANGVRSTNHPAPELAEGEAPFWVRTGAGRRQRATPASDVKLLRPRALTLTLFARVCLGDFFIHGIGGGKYDEVTDALIRGYFGIEPPAYQVLSATLHLPLPAFPATAHDLHVAERRARDLRWNPHALPTADAGLVREHAALTAREPARGAHAARREWFRALRNVKEKLREGAANEVPVAETELRRVRAEVAANAILRRRDYPWVLYPEEVLKPFLQSLRALAAGAARA